MHCCSSISRHCSSGGRGALRSNQEPCLLDGLPAWRAALAVSAISRLSDDTTARVQWLVGAHARDACNWPPCCQLGSAISTPPMSTVCWLQVPPVLSGDERGGGTENASLHVPKLHRQARSTTRCAPSCPKGGSLRQSDTDLLQLGTLTPRGRDTRHTTRVPSATALLTACMG